MTSSTQAQRTLLLFRAMVQGDELTATKAFDILKESGIEGISLRTIQRDLKMIADTFSDVKKISAFGNNTRYSITGFNESNNSKKSSSEKKTTKNPDPAKDIENNIKEGQSGNEKPLDKIPTNKKPKAKKGNKGKVATEHKEKEEDQVYPTSENKTEKVKKKKEKTSRFLPQGFNNIDEFELKAQKYLKEYSKAKIDISDNDIIIDYIERNSINPSSVKTDKKGRMTVNLKKMKAKKLVSFIKDNKKSITLF